MSVHFPTIKETKMKLYIDDIRQVPDDSWVLARTIDSAINAIATFDFDVISLDHDISHYVVMDGVSRPFPCAETFTPVALYIDAKYLPNDRKPKIIIHTSNPVGAEKMKAILKDFDVTVSESRPANRLELEI